MKLSVDAEAFRDALLRLMPRGFIWPRHESSILAQLCRAWGQTFARHSDRSANLLTDVAPASSIETLPEWEATVGLPSACSGLATTTQARRQQVLGRLTRIGSASIPAMIAQARSLGFEVSVLEYAPARADIFRAGGGLYSEVWAFAWSIQSVTVLPTYFAADVSQADDALLTRPDTNLYCEMRALNPAHCQLFISTHAEKKHAEN